MPFFARNKLLVLLLAILLVSNGIFIAYFLNGGNTKKGDRDQGKFGQIVPDWLSKDVGFDSIQMKRYYQLREVNRTLMKTAGRSMGETKDRFYLMLKYPQLDSLAYDSLLSQIGNRQEQLDRLLFRHMREIRSLCTPQQLPTFDAQSQETIQRLISPYRRHQKKEGKDN